MAANNKGPVLKPINTKRVDSTLVDEPLSPVARMFNAPKMKCYIIAEMGCKTKIDVEALKEGAKHTLLNHPRFSSKLAAKA